MNKHMTIIQEIFAYHYEEILYTLHPRATEIENIEKMVNCGNLYSQKRAEAMANQLVAVRHRHCVFTIPEELRHFFKDKRILLDCLFNAVHSVVSRMFYSVNKSKNFTPGFICVLHTFGRPLEWNPHIHCLISEGGHSDDGEWRNIHHFNYKLLRESIQVKEATDMTEEELAEELRKKYILNPPEGMTSDDIRYMSVGDLLDMDYFLNDEDTDDVGEEGFYIF